MEAGNAIRIQNVLNLRERSNLGDMMQSTLQMQGKAGKHPRLD